MPFIYPNSFVTFPVFLLSARVLTQLEFLGWYNQSFLTLLPSCLANRHSRQQPARHIATLTRVLLTAKPGLSLTV